jgi:hypothetical protein
MRAPLPVLDALDIEALKALILSHHEEKQRQLEVSRASLRRAISESMEERSSEVFMKTSVTEGQPI